MSEYTYDKNRQGDHADDQNATGAGQSSRFPTGQTSAGNEAPGWGEDDWSLRSSSVEDDDPLIKLARLMELNQQNEPAPAPVPLAPTIAPVDATQQGNLPAGSTADLVGDIAYQGPAGNYAIDVVAPLASEYAPAPAAEVPVSSDFSAPVLPTAELQSAPADVYVPANAPVVGESQVHDPFAPGGSGKLAEPTDFDVSRMPRAIRPATSAEGLPLSGVQGQAGADLVQAAAIPERPEPYSPPVAPAFNPAPQPIAASTQNASILDPVLSNPVPAPAPAAPAIAPASAVPLAPAAVTPAAAVQPAAELTAAVPAPDFSYLREVEDLRVPSQEERDAVIAQESAQTELPGVVHMPIEGGADLADDDYDDTDFDTGGVFANRGMMVAAGVIAFVVLGGAALLAYQAMFSGSDNNPPPLLLASKDAVRLLPDGQAASGGLAPNTGSLSESGSPAEGGRLVSRSEQPVTSLNPNINGERVARVILPNPADGAANQTRLSPTSEPLGPRPVKTFIVRPDGSIVNNSPATDTGTGSSAIKPRTVKTQVINNSGTSAPVAASNQRLNVSGPIPRVRPGGSNTVTAVNTATGTRASLPVAPRVSVGTQAVNTTAPVVVQPVQPVVVQPQRTVAVQPASTGSGDFVVQVSSQRSLSAAESALSGLKSRFPSVLGNVGSDIAKADLGARGIYYRVRVGNMETRGEAAEFCNRLKNAGGDCIVARR